MGFFWGGGGVKRGHFPKMENPFSEKRTFSEKKIARRRRRKKYGIYRISESVFRVENMFKSCNKPKNFGACGRQILLLTSNYTIFRCKTREKTRQTGEISPKAKKNRWKFLPKANKIVFFSGGGGQKRTFSENAIFRLVIFRVSYAPPQQIQYQPERKRRLFWGIS